METLGCRVMLARRGHLDIQAAQSQALQAQLACLDMKVQWAILAPRGRSVLRDFRAILGMAPRMLA
jgi:hypothetical protein